MDSNYIITSSGAFVNIDDIYHSGIKGMKWGVRRYQNPDGSLTPAGKKRYTNSDGTLNKKGEKFYSKETARLKAESERLANEKKTAAKFAKLDQMRKKNSDLKDEIDGKKTETDSKSDSKVSTRKLPKEHDVSSLTTKEIQDYNTRMQTEENFKQLLEKRGYKVSLDQKTEIDQRIDDLNKQKTLMQLEKDVVNLARRNPEFEKKIEQLTQKRDISKLEKEIRDNTPKKESKFSKFINSQAGQNITNQLIKSGENVLTAYMNKKGDKNADLTSEGIKQTVNKVGKTLGKEAKKVAESVEKQTKKQAAKEAKAAVKEAKQEAKAAQKQTREGAKKTAESSKVHKGTVEGEGTSRSTNKTRKGPIIDAEDYTETYSNKPITSLSKTSKQNGYDYIEKIKTDYGYRYVYELPAPKDDD